MHIPHRKKGPLISTIEQAKRLIKVVVGFTIILGGLAMLVLPGPGIVTILGGLAILATEFVWARKLMKRFEHHANNIKNSIVDAYNNNNKGQKAKSRE